MTNQLNCYIEQSALDRTRITLGLLTKIGDPGSSPGPTG